MTDLPPPPPPPPPPPAGDAAGSGGNVDVGQAVGYGWKKFSSNPINWVLLALIPFLASAFGSVVQIAVGRNSFGATLFGFFLSIIFFCVTLIVQYGLVRAALLTTEGQTVSVGDAWKDTSQLGNYIVAAILQGLLVGVGFIFCFFPGLILLFLTIFTPFFVIDQRMGAVDAIKASISLVSKNVGKLILFIIVAMLIYFLGVLVCFVGLLVTIPVVLIASAKVFKDMTGQPVAA
jgi:uncharacterized membrane protein